MECEFGEREARGCVSAHEWRCETHVCTWDCQVEHVIGNMFRCLSTGHVHICDCNCRNRVDYGPNEEICFVSRRVFEKRRDSPAPSRKRGAVEVAEEEYRAVETPRSVLPRTLHNPKFVSAFSFAREAGGQMPVTPTTPTAVLQLQYRDDIY
ncbi:hypothetical protein HKI87_08g51710 [Chloropicon roscoffensis]|uniref:Uncharacterized protein n=1 Tax=Chloropicon roscoffensis TaxID=1461544 RepID=A0AAX4PB69_9CHLO|mmetsp:Transcript_8248/g.24748  ORF Transcript_8248/g.24748 Transcript_8248/m.24748 type:complete len:152 (-) Transcript_8248:62-517(-)